MRRCVVHFGMPKTGSTSIQASLMAAGSMPGWHYLSSGDEKNSSRLIATMFFDDPGRFHLNRKWAFSDEDLADMKVEAMADFERQMAGPAELFVFSAEALSSMDEPTLQRMRDWLGEHFDSVEAVGYVRKPRGYMDSELQQQIKSGRKHFNAASHYPGYQARFEPIERVFGRDKVSYWLFEPDRFPQKDVVRDFTTRLGIDIPDAAIKRANSSLSRDAASLLYIYRKHGPGYGRGVGVVEENTRLQRALSALGGNKLRLATEVVQPILEEHADDIAWMEGRLGESLKENISGDDAGSISIEDDLLKPSPEAIAWLRQKLGREEDTRLNGESLDVVAEAIHSLRLQLSGSTGQAKRAAAASGAATAAAANPAGAVTWDAHSLAEKLCSEGLWPRVEDRVDRAAELLQTVLAKVGEYLDGAGTTSVVESLGKFKPRDGKPGTFAFKPIAAEEAALALQAMTVTKTKRADGGKAGAGGKNDKAGKADKSERVEQGEKAGKLQGKPGNKLANKPGDKAGGGKANKPAKARPAAEDDDDEQTVTTADASSSTEPVSSAKAAGGASKGGRRSGSKKAAA